MIPNPGHWQVGKHFVGGFEAVELDVAAGRGDESGMRVADPLGLARCTGCVEHHAGVFRCDIANGTFEESDILPVELAADFAQPVVGQQLRLFVVAQAARIVEEDVLELRILRQDIEQLVDLFLVFDDGKFDLAVVEDEKHLLGDRVLVHRHRYAAEALRCGKRPIQARAIVTDEGEVHAAPEPLRGQAAGKRAHLVGYLGPGPALPDAEIFLADGSAVALLPCMPQQKLGKGVSAPVADGFRLRQALPPCFSVLAPAIGQQRPLYHLRAPMSRCARCANWKGQCRRWGTDA